MDYQDVLASPTPVYEEGLRFFRGQGMANDALRRLVADLNAQGIDYAVIGVVALKQHGKGLADVQELVRVRGLDEAFAERLDPSVRDKYLELHLSLIHI